MTKLTYCLPACFALAACLATSAPALANTSLPLGHWQLADDGLYQQEIEITTQSGKLQARIIKISDRSGKQQSPVCDRCEGDLQGKQLVGMTVMWDLQQDGEEWTGGEFLEAATGTVYSAKLKLSEDGSALALRTFRGISLFGRTQTWAKARDEKAGRVSTLPVSIKVSEGR